MAALVLVLFTCHVPLLLSSGSPAPLVKAVGFDLVLLPLGLLAALGQLS